VILTYCIHTVLTYTVTNAIEKGSKYREKNKIVHGSYCIVKHTLNQRQRVFKKKGKGLFCMCRVKKCPSFFSIIKTSLEQMGNNIKEELRVRS